MTGVAFSATSSAAPLSEITSDPRVEAIESEIGSLSYGDTTESTYDVNEYVDIDDDADIKHTSVETDNGTLEYAKGYKNGTLDNIEAMLFDFSHWDYEQGDIGTHKNSIIGYSDGTTRFKRTGTNSEMDDADASLDHDYIMGHTSDDVSGNLYPAWDDGDSDYTLYDDDDVSSGGGGGGDDDQTLKGVRGSSGPQTLGKGSLTTSSCETDDTDMWLAIGTGIASVGLTVTLAFYPATWVLYIKQGITYASTLWTVIECVFLE